MLTGPHSLEEFLIPMNPKYISISSDLYLKNQLLKKKLLLHKDAADGPVYYFAIQEFYEREGGNEKGVLTSKKDFQEIFYGGKFEVKLTNAFSVLDKNSDHHVHTDVMKLMMLNSKIRANFLVAMKTNIEMQMNMQPMVMTYTSTLSNYLNTVNQRHPNANNPNKTRNRIQTLADCGGKGRGGERGSGSGGQGGRGRRYGKPNACRNYE